MGQPIRGVFLAMHADVSACPIPPRRYRCHRRRLDLDLAWQQRCAQIFRSKVKGVATPKGIAFPTCVSVNECVTNNSPLESEASKHVRNTQRRTAERVGTERMRGEQVSMCFRRREARLCSGRANSMLLNFWRHLYFFSVRIISRRSSQLRLCRWCSRQC